MPPSTMPPLPIDAVLPELGRHLAAGPSCVLEAEPGAGKTTRVPLALLEAEWLAGQKIVLLEPRRLAARAAAHFMAAALGEEPGLTVGYRMRQATCVSEKTRLEVVTEGVLSRLLQDDPELSGVGCVVFDEFHERSLQADTGLAFCLEVQRELRPDLRILVMSATMDCQAVARLLGGAPVVSCPGRNFPVQVRHGDLRPRESREEAVARAVRQALGEEEGSLLVFLPGAAEIRRTAELLERSGIAPSIDIAPLLGSLSLAEQERAIRPAPVGRRKVVLATSIAETSLTIEGIRVVIDSGLSRVPRFDPASGMTRLVTVPVSRATASQRKGRAGRLAPGVCYRLWEAMSHGTLQPFNQPEIMAADLAALVLELANWGTAEPRELAFLDQPPAAAWQQARELLTLLGGLDKAGRITSHGKLMAALPTHPRLAHMLLRGRDLGLGALACELAALLEERDVLHEQAGYRDVDLRLRVELLHEKSDRARQAEAARHGLRLDTGLLRRVREGAERFRQRLGLRQEKTGSAPCGLLLALAYPDRLGRRRPGSNHRYKLSNGRGAFLPEGSPLGHETEFLVAANLDGERSEARVFLAAPMEKADLPRAFGSRLQSEAKIAWNPASRAVEAVREVRLAGLVVGEEPLARPDPDLVTAALVAGIRELGANCLPWNRELRQWQARVLLLRQTFGPEAWPDVSDETLFASLEQWLSPWLAGMSRAEHLVRLDLKSALEALLGWAYLKKLEQLAPTHLEVPSGSKIRIDYAADGPPVLAVRLQEMFGLAETPKIAENRVELLLHLLSPAMRPVQVTRDLKNFWQTTYHEVKKELKARYPKHSWPDDPWKAEPTRRTTRKKGEGRREK